MARLNRQQGRQLGRQMISDTTVAAVEAALAAGASSPADVAAATGKSDRAVRYALADLRRRGVVVGSKHRPRLAGSARARSVARPPALSSRPAGTPRRPDLQLRPLEALVVAPARPAPRRLREASSVHAAAYPHGRAGRVGGVAELDAAAVVGIAPPLPLVPEELPETPPRPGLLAVLAYTVAGSALGAPVSRHGN